MDIAPPLLELRARLGECGDSANPMKLRIERTVQASLEQWGRAYYHCTKLRRDSYVKAVEPSIQYLLKEPDALPAGKEARQHLFSDAFLARQLKEAQNDVTLSEADKAKATAEAAALAAKRKKQSANIRYVQVEASSSKKNGGGGFKNFGFQPKKGGGKKDKDTSSSNRWYEKSLADSPLTFPSIVPSTPLTSKVGARLRLFAANWETVTEDPWVLATVREGLSIDFISYPRQDVAPGDISMTEEMICDAEIVSLLEKGVVTEISDHSDGYVCAFFCIPKKGKGLFRPIVNMRPVNNCINTYEHTKMESLNSVRFLVRKGDFMVKVDLKDAYFVVPVKNSHCKYLRFSWVYRFCCMAFGLAPVPRVFTKLMKVVVAILRKRGI